VNVVFFDGRFVAEAAIPIDDPGYLRGEGVFATLRGYAGRCFEKDAHLTDLARGADALGIAVPLEHARLAALVDEAATRTGAADAWVRVTLTHGSRLSILARPMDLPSDEDYAAGVAAVIVGPRRIPAECMDPRVKHTSYAAQILARREAEARGAVEAIQLAIDGALAAGAMSNLFVVVGGELLTPSLASGCRDGVTRRALLRLADVREARLDPSILASADEAFFTSTRVECLPIATVDGRAVGTGRYLRATQLRRALRELASRG
jgi:branched-chain amino acid aminotransferase